LTKVTVSLKVGTFLRHGVVYILIIKNRQYITDSSVVNIRISIGWLLAHY